MAKPRIYADFNNWAKEGLRLNCRGTRDDLQRLGLELKEGLEAIFYDEDADDDGKRDDLEVEGVVKFLPETNEWVAVADYEKIRHASDPIL